METAFVEVKTFHIFCPGCDAPFLTAAGEQEWTWENLQKRLKETQCMAPTCPTCGDRFYLPSSAHLT